MNSVYSITCDDERTYEDFKEESMDVLSFMTKQKGWNYIKTEEDYE